VCVCVCVCKRERERVCVRERESVLTWKCEVPAVISKVCVRVCVCMCEFEVPEVPVVTIKIFKYVHMCVCVRECVYVCEKEWCVTLKCMLAYLRYVCCVCVCVRVLVGL